MSREDKRYHQAHVLGTREDASVRLYAFANTRNGYNVCFAPEQPLIVLKTRRNNNNNNATTMTTAATATAAASRHPCAQWLTFATHVFAAQPNTTHAVYVVDTTAVTCSSDASSSSSVYMQDERVSGARPGAVLRRLGNVLCRLNPHQGTLIAAGAATWLAWKYMLVGEKALGHRDRLLRRLVLVQPTSLAAMRALVTAAMPHAASLSHNKNNNNKDTSAASAAAVRLTYLPFEVHVLLSDGSDGSEAAAAAWRAWLDELCRVHGVVSSYTVRTGLSPSSLFATVAAAAGVVADGTHVDTQCRYTTPRVYRIDFMLSRHTKTVVQVPTLSSLDGDGCDDGGGGQDDKVHDDAGDKDAAQQDKKDDEDDGDNVKAVHHDDGSRSCDEDTCHGDDDGDDDDDVVVHGLTQLQHTAGSRVRVHVEGRIVDLDRELLGTTEGCVVVRGLRDAIARDATLRRRLQRRGGGGGNSSRTAASSSSPSPTAYAGAAVAVDDALLQRTRDGRMLLRVVDSNAAAATHAATTVRALTRDEAAQSMTTSASLRTLPLYTLSDVAHSYGAVIVRGRKCALVRCAVWPPSSSSSLRNSDNTARDECDTTQAHNDTKEALCMPHTPHNRTAESCMDCAMRALCDAYDISSDNVYVPAYLPPVVYYVTEPASSRSSHGDAAEATRRGVRCVTVYTALAVSASSRVVANDAYDEDDDNSNNNDSDSDEEEEQRYEWVSFAAALTRLRTTAECDALTRLQQHLRTAFAAGVYAPVRGCGLFGDALLQRQQQQQQQQQQQSRITTTTVTATASRRVRGTIHTSSSPSLSSCSCCSLDGLEVVAVVCPGGGARELVPVLRAALRVDDVYTYTSTNDDSDNESSNDDDSDDESSDDDNESSDGASTRRIVAAARAACTRGVFVVYVDDACDGRDEDEDGSSGSASLSSLCERVLPHLTTRCGARARVVTLLLPDVIAELTCLRNDMRSSCHRRCAARMALLYDAVRVSDMLLLVRHDDGVLAHARVRRAPSQLCGASSGHGCRCAEYVWPAPATVAVVSSCLACNADVDVYDGMTRRVRVTLPPSPPPPHSDNNNDGDGRDGAVRALLHRVSLTLPCGDSNSNSSSSSGDHDNDDDVARRTRQLCSALLRPGSLACFDRCAATMRLLYAVGSAQAGDAASAQRRVRLHYDAAQRCMQLDEAAGNDDNDDDDVGDASSSSNSSSCKDAATRTQGVQLVLLVWCTPAAVGDVDAMAQSLLTMTRS